VRDGPELVEAFLDGELSSGNESELAEWLNADPENLRSLVREAHLHHQLRQLHLAERSVFQLKTAPVRKSEGAHGAPGWLEQLWCWARNVSLPRAAASVAFILVLSVLWWGIRNATDPRALQIGHVINVVGTPSVHRNGKELAELAAASSVQLGDRVETRDAESVEIRFNDGTTLQLHFNTVVEIPRPDRDRNPASTFTRPPEVQLLQGQIWTVVQKTTNGTSYAIRTHAATALARGTEFGVKIQRPLQLPQSTIAPAPASQTTVLTVKEGTVDFFNEVGSVQATAMTESTARLGSAPTEPKRLQALQSVHSGSGVAWSVLTSPLDWADSSERMAGGAGWPGFQARTMADSSASAAPAVVRVTHVSANSPASRAGLRIGDRIGALDDQPVTDAGAVSRTFLLNPGRPVKLTLRRGGEELAVELASEGKGSILPGPSLTLEQQAQVLERTRTLAATPAQAARRRENREAAAIQNNLGVLLETQDEMGPAVRAYRRAVQADPELPLYRFNLGLALRKIGSFERALEELSGAVQLDPNSIEGRKRLAEVYSLLGHYSHSLEQTEAALQAAPEDHGLWELKAQTLTRQGRNAEALEAARRAVETEPGCAIAHQFLGGALMRTGGLAAAEAAYRKSIELSPYDGVSHMNLGVLFSRRMELERAEQALRRAIEVEPGLVQAHRNLSWVLIERGAWEEAGTILDHAAQIAPEDVEVVHDLGRLALQQNQLDRAETHFHHAAEMAPHHPDSWFGLGEVWRERGQAEEAERMYLKVLDLAPGHREAFQRLGYLYRQVFRTPVKAEELYRRFIRANPGWVEAYSGLAQLLAQRNELAEAEQLMRRARDLSPNTPGIHNALGEVLRMRGNFNEALQSYERALQLSPNNPYFQNNIGIVHSMRGEHTEAEALFRELLERAAKNPSINPLPFLSNLALACKDQGKAREAEQYFRKALALAPDDAEIRNNFASFLAERDLYLDEALQLATSAVAAEPNNPSFLHTLGTVHLHRREFDAAETSLQRALELTGENPQSAEIRSALQQLNDARKQN
jgi:Flp pilus assembly protein TadD